MKLDVYEVLRRCVVLGKNCDMDWTTEKWKSFLMRTKARNEEFSSEQHLFGFLINFAKEKRI